MGKKLTFKEYLESKRRLLEAIKENPHQTVCYNVRRYCKVAVGESKENKHYINLKPHQTILVEWLFTAPDTPTIVGLKFDKVPGVELAEEFSPFWSTERTHKWLQRNTREQN